MKLTSPANNDTNTSANTFKNTGTCNFSQTHNELTRLLCVHICVRAYTMAYTYMSMFDFFDFHSTGRSLCGMQ